MSCEGNGVQYTYSLTYFYKVFFYYLPVRIAHTYFVIKTAIIIINYTYFTFFVLNLTHLGPDISLKYCQIRYYLIQTKILANRMRFQRKGLDLLNTNLIWCHQPTPIHLVYLTQRTIVHKVVLSLATKLDDRCVGLHE